MRRCQVKGLLWIQFSSCCTLIILIYVMMRMTRIKWHMMASSQVRQSERILSPSLQKRVFSLDITSISSTEISSISISLLLQQQLYGIHLMYIMGFCDAASGEFIIITCYMIIIILTMTLWLLLRFSRFSRQVVSGREGGRERGWVEMLVTSQKSEEIMRDERRGIRNNAEHQRSAKVSDPCFTRR